DPRSATWRDRRGRAARWPDLEDLTRQRTTRIVLAAAHVNHDPTRSGRRNLRAWCQACHLAHDRASHLLQRWITFRLRYARGDVFLGPYQHGPSAAILLSEILARISGRLSNRREPESRRLGAVGGSGRSNLRAWCQACHLAHDRASHLLQRWITFRLRYARGDVFLGPYQHGPSAAILLSEILARISGRLSNRREPESRRLGAVGGSG